MFKRKLKKFIRDPKLFLSDMAVNHTKKIDFLRVKKNNGHFQYTVVSAVYNVGRYLEDYFGSITRQKLHFRKHIKLILVDDGSTDDSSEIIKKWQKRYPKNIIYIWKENGGQASARNLGLQSVKTEWVTFIDPDDFIDIDYFNKIDNLIYKNDNKNISMISCNFIFYMEDKNTYSNTHPLNYRFKDGDKILPVMNMEKNPQLHVNSVVFRRDVIIDNKVEFDDRIKPNFEDGHFVANYIMATRQSHIAFCSKAKYFYRKRSDGSSSLDTAWEKIGKYTNVLEYGYLDLLKKFDRLGSIPKSIQWTVLYDLIWHFKRIVQHPERLNILDESQKERYFSLLSDIFKYIEEKQIIEFNLAGAWFYHKVGMLGLFKNTSPSFQIVYAEDFDFSKNQVMLRYFFSQSEFENITIDGKDIVPDYAKNVLHDFVGRPFCYERRIWLYIPSDAKEIKFEIGNVPTKISLGGRQSAKGILVNEIKRHFESLRPKFDVDPEYSNAWIFMDRDVQADDNAEHLYRYMQHKHPEQKKYFVLQQNSHDWKRLQSDGFELIDFGSDAHKKALQNCSKVISSHADHYITNYLGKNMLRGKHFVFLQHGVTKDDISAWLNTKEQINCVITTSHQERNSLCANDTRYKFTEKEVVLTGFPRHDFLLKNNSLKENTILFMPTWRKNILGRRISGGSEFEINDEFISSDFFIHWQNILTSPFLEDIARKYNYNIVFFPHAYIQPYIDLFKLPEHVKVMNHVTGSMQQLFIESSILVTDYSSVAFEMAVQKKTVIYYQFDEESFFSGSHNYVRGYFDYRQHGFGPVVINQEQLFDELNKKLNVDNIPDSQIIERMESAFPFQDGNNCERTYQAIIALDAPREPNFINISLFVEYAQNASDNQAWGLAEKRWKKIYESPDKNYRHIVCLNIAKALRMQGKTNEAWKYFEEYDALRIIHCLPLDQKSQLEKAELLMASERWDQASIIWSGLQSFRALYEPIKHLRCLAAVDDFVNASKILESSDIKSRAVHEQICCAAVIDSINKNWQAVVEKLSIIVDDLSLHELQMLKPEIMLARAYRKLNKQDAANHHLLNYAKHTKSDFLWQKEIILLSFSQNDYTKTYKQIAHAFPNTYDLPQSIASIYLKSLRITNQLELASDVVTFLKENNKINFEIMIEVGEIAIANQNWESAVDIWGRLAAQLNDAPYKQALALRMLGDIELALQILDNTTTRKPCNAEEWILKAEIASLNERWQQAAMCWRELLRLYPSQAPSYSWERMQSALLLVRNEAQESDLLVNG